MRSDPRPVWKRLPFLALAALPLLAGGAPSALAHEGHDGPEAGPNDPRAPRRLSEAAIRNGGITLADVTPQRIERVIEVPGRVAPRPESVYDLHAPIEGVILSVGAAAGTRVPAGTVLARLGGPAIASLVGDWSRATKDAAGTERARAQLEDLVRREVTMELETRRGDLLVAIATEERAAGDLEAAVKGGGGLPERERWTRETAEKEARVRLEGHRARLLAAGLTPEELARLEAAPANRPLATTLGLDASAAMERFRPLATHAADLLERTREALAATTTLESIRMKVRLTGLALEDLQGLEADGSEPAVPLRTPVAGLVSTLAVHRGHWVVAGAEIASVVDPAAVQIEALLPESDFGRIAQGAVARVRRGGRSDVLLQGVVRYVAPTVDPLTRRLSVIADLENAGGLPIGLGVDVTLVVEALERAKSIPVSAVLAEGADRYVYKLKDGAFVRTEVVLGARDDRLVQVLEGLYDGERVIATGADLVRDTPPAAPTVKPAAAKDHP